MRSLRPPFAAASGSLFAVALLLASCSSELESPSPSFNGEPGASSPDEAVAHPGFVCSAQESKWIQLNGENFSPVPIGVVEDGDRTVNWPEIELTRTANLSGEEIQNGMSVSISARGKVFGGGDGIFPPERADIGVVDDAGSGNGSDDESNGSGAGDIGFTGPDEDAGAAGGSDDAGGSKKTDRNIIWLDDASLRFKVSPSMKLRGGLYDITIEAARIPGEFQVASSKTATAKKAFGVLPPPWVARTARNAPVCLEEGQRQIRLAGGHFLKREDRKPTVRIGDREVSVDGMQACRKPGAAFGPYEVCQGMNITVPQGAFPSSTPAVHVRNFGPAGCRNYPDLTGAALKVVESPTVSGVEPQPICTRQEDYDVTITGKHFVKGATVQIGDHTIQGANFSDCSGSSCSTITTEIEEGTLAGGEVEGLKARPVQVTNPDSVGCTSGDDTTMKTVGPPTVERVVPGAIVDGEDASIRLEGKNFVAIDDQLPELTLTKGGTEKTYRPASMEECRTPATGGPRRAAVCEALEFELPSGDFGISDGQTASVELQMVNPEPLECRLAESSETTLTLVESPTLSAVETAPICTADQSKEVTLTGSNFAVFEGEGPTVTVGLDEYDASGVAETCESVGNASSQVEMCSQIRFEVPADVLRAARHSLTVYNPDRVGGYTSTSDVSLHVVGPPAVEEIEPALTCLAEGSRTVTLRGTNFLRIIPDTMTDPIELPNVDISETSVTVAERSIPNPEENCEPFPVAGSQKQFQRCDTMEVTLESAGESGSAAITLTNPGEANCSTDGETTVEISPRPGVSSAEVAPESSCEEAGYRRVVVGGSNFLKKNGELPKVTIDSKDYEPLEAEGCEPIDAPTGDELAYCSKLIVYGKTADVSGARTVTVENASPASCASNLASFDITEVCP